MNERSKYLSYLLRHKPEQVGLKLDREGWVTLDELLGKTDFKHAEVLELVAQDAKERYALDTRGDVTYIRANQGHSTSQVELTFKRAAPPTVLYHGTTHRNIDRVLKEGLKPMGRHHVHLSAQIDVARDVGGRRKGEAIVLEIDAKRMCDDGVIFYQSQNNVWLVSRVETRYFKEIP